MDTFDDAKQEQPDWRINYEAAEEQTIGADALTTKNLICWSLQIARGMVYLASKKVSTSVLQNNYKEFNNKLHII